MRTINDFLIIFYKNINPSSIFFEMQKLLRVHEIETAVAARFKFSKTFIVQNIYQVFQNENLLQFRKHPQKRRKDFH